MNKKELINAVAELVNGEEKLFTKKEIAEVVEAVFNAITDAMVDGETVNVSGFGKFEAVERAERTGRNPQTGEELTIPACRAPKFKASSLLKEAVR